MLSTPPLARVIYHFGASVHFTRTWKVHTKPYPPFTRYGRLRTVVEVDMRFADVHVVHHFIAFILGAWANGLGCSPLPLLVSVAMVAVILTRATTASNNWWGSWL